MSTEALNAKIVNSPVALALKNEFATAPRLREGDVVEATLIGKTPKGAFFDVGKFGTGIVYGAELQHSRDTLKNLDLGKTIAAKVEVLEGYLGYVELSLSEAGKQKVWHDVKVLEESGEIVKVKAMAANQGGLICDLAGLKAFLPVSQLSGEHAITSADEDKTKLVEELKKYLGQEFSVKVINVNPRANKLIVSERETANPTVNIKELLGKYTVGEEVDGLVSGIADFGIFIRFTDNPEIEGLVHISEIDHRIIDNPKEVVKLNESVKVKIIDIRDGRVFLSLKALKADPWARVAELYKEGEEVRGRVYKFNPFGAIIDLEQGLQGMIHVSEYGGQDEMKKALVPQSSYSFVIGAVKPDEKRIILKAKK
ncbi:MAG: S1 RNA-binding domain-containing protein [bacterium]|nr:S1 RNA-binding domain-containing protein [bacterium]